MDILCKPSDYYMYSKTLANKYGVEVAILVSYLYDILECEPVNLKLNYNHIKTMTGLSKAQVKEAAKILQNNNLLSITISDDVIISMPKATEKPCINTGVADASSVIYAETLPLDESISVIYSDTLPFGNEIGVPFTEPQELTTDLRELTDKYIYSNKKKINCDTKDDVCREIVDYANKIWHTSHTCNNTTKKLIKQWLERGYTKEDFFKVIDDRYSEWGVRPIMFKGSGTMSNEYLRPKTVFASNFKEYVKKAETNKKFKASPAVHKKASEDICEDLEF